MTHDITALDLLAAEQPTPEAGLVTTRTTGSGQDCLHDARY